MIKKIIKINKYPDEKIASKHIKDSDSLREDLIGYIDEAQFEGISADEFGNFIIKIQINYRNLGLKESWGLDGGRLLEVNKETIEEIKKKDSTKENPLIEVESQINNDEIDNDEVLP